MPNLNVVLQYEKKLITFPKELHMTVEFTRNSMRIKFWRFRNYSKWQNTAKMCYRCSFFTQLQKKGLIRIILTLCSFQNNLKHIELEPMRYRTYSPGRPKILWINLQITANTYGAILKEINRKTSENVYEPAFYKFWYGCTSSKLNFQVKLITWTVLNRITDTLLYYS